MNPLINRICRPLARELVQRAKTLGHDSELVKQALAYGARAHAGQRRKTGEFYFLHSMQVAGAVQVLGGAQVDVIAAFNHDVVEDCLALDIHDIEVAWGLEVAARVLPLTKDYRLPTSEQRVQDAFGRLWQAIGHHGNGVALVKLLDRAHNAATSEVLSGEKLARMRQENKHMFAPLARFIGAPGIADFLDAAPERWWLARSDFVGHMQSCQPRLSLA